MQTGPDLISAAVEGRKIGDIADIVIGQLEHVSVAIRRAALDLLTERGEEFTRNADNRHVAHEQNLDPGLALLLATVPTSSA